MFSAIKNISMSVINTVSSVVSSGIRAVGLAGSYAVETSGAAVVKSGLFVRKMMFATAQRTAHIAIVALSNLPTWQSCPRMVRVKLLATEVRTNDPTTAVTRLKVVLSLFGNWATRMEALNAAAIGENPALSESAIERVENLLGVILPRPYGPLDLNLLTAVKNNI